MGNLPYSNVERQANDAKEIAELEKLMQEGAEPTQSQEGSTEGSPKEESDRIAEQITDQQEPVQDLQYWKERALSAENRFNVSKPKYDSNIFNLRKENTKLRSDWIESRKQLNELRQSVASSKPDKVTELFSKKEVVDVLGQETANTIKETIVGTNARVDLQEKRLADKELLDDQNRLNRDIDKRYNTFMNMLSDLVPDQEALNKDQGFLKYLQGVDQDLGVVRFDLLREAEKAGNARRVASFFNGYKKERDTNLEPPKDSINKRIAPDSTTSSNADQNIGDASGKKITMAFIDKFYHEVTKGVYRGRHKEKLEIQQRIDNAYISGNII